MACGPKSVVVEVQAFHLAHVGCSLVKASWSRTAGGNPESRGLWSMHMQVYIACTCQGICDSWAETLRVGHCPRANGMAGGPPLDDRIHGPDAGVFAQHFMYMLRHFGTQASLGIDAA